MNNLETAVEKKVVAGATTWGLKSYFAHTPDWAKKLAGIIAVACLGTTITLQQAGVIPDKYAFALSVVTLALTKACDFFGVHCPLDENGKVVPNIVDQPLITTSNGNDTN